MYNVLERVNQQYRFNIHEHVGENDSLTIELRNAHGPLFNRNNTTHMIKLDISLREFTVLAPKLHYMLPIYPDIKQFSVYSMELDEILAEKVRAIYTRTKARDIYDLYFILDKRAGNFRKDLVNKKLSGYKIIFTYDSFIKRIKDVSEKLWKEELSSVLLNPPNYGAVVNYISKEKRSNPYIFCSAVLYVKSKSSEKRSNPYIFCSAVPPLNTRSLEKSRYISFSNTV